MYLWTSEFVARGHPDKVADQIADSVLDAHLEMDPAARVACEVMVMRDLIVVGGEIASEARIDVESVVRDCVCGLGYDRPGHCFDGTGVEILDRLAVQSPEIGSAVCRDDGQIGAGDQGVMFGHATRKTPNHMPLVHELARELIFRLEEEMDRGKKTGAWESPFLPDAKSQVTVRFEEDGRPAGIDTIVLSALHSPETSVDEVRTLLRERIIGPMREKHPHLFGRRTKFVLNPSGAWHTGGPAADTGLTGRKTVIDSYGSDCPIGGGSYSGKDPTKVDRSAAYMARYIARNLVAADLADRVTVQISYAIGIAEPVSLRVSTHGTGKRDSDAKLARRIAGNLDLTPRGIIERFDLRRPIYRETAAGGHFGRESFPWEELDPAWGST